MSRIIGSLQDPCSLTESVGLTFNSIAVLVPPSAVPVPICIRCGYSIGINLVIVTDPNNVTYVDGDGQTITNSTDVIITNNGLILNDPLGSFDDGESIICNSVDDGTMSGEYDITIKIFSEPVIKYCSVIVY